MPRKPPSAADCKLTAEHFRRKVALLVRQLDDARLQLEHAEKELAKAETRERKIQDSKL